MRYARVQGDAKCECADAHCPVHSPNASCVNKSVEVLWRVDMDDANGTWFCEACADDAFGSGLFTDSVGDEDEFEDDSESERA